VPRDPKNETKTAAPLSSPNIPYLCSRDAGNLIPIAETACPRCSLPLASPVEACPDCHDIEWAFDRALSLFQYKEPVSQIIQSFKYDKKRFLIRSLKALMQMQMKKKISVNSAQIVTSVPLSAEKEKERGFNDYEAEAISVCS
jgi:predicted amidophosphoribosyltransferase